MRNSNGFSKGVIRKRYFLHCGGCGENLEVTKPFWQGWVSPYELRTFICGRCERADFLRRFPIGSKRPTRDFSSLIAELTTYADDRMWRAAYGDVEVAGAEEIRRRWGDNACA